MYANLWLHRHYPSSILLRSQSVSRGFDTYAGGFAPYGAAYGAGPAAAGGGLYGAPAAMVPSGPGFAHGYGYPHGYGYHHGHPHHRYAYGDHSIVHNERVGNTVSGGHTIWIEPACRSPCCPTGFHTNSLVSFPSCPSLLTQSPLSLTSPLAPRPSTVGGVGQSKRPAILGPGTSSQQRSIAERQLRATA